MESATKLRVCMDRDDSITYVGFSFRSMRSYYGLVEACPPHKRWVEHWRAIKQHRTGLAVSREEQYAYMAANGGISQWFFLPYISCGKQIELNRLQQLEQSIIRRFPNALNKCRHPANPHRVMQSSVNLDKHAKDTARKADRKGYDDSRVDTEVTYVNSLSSQYWTTCDSFDQVCYEYMPHNCMAFIISMEHYTVCETMG